mgnify:CR=1 FL=1
MKKNFELAIKNIAKFGDTDIFPFPIENAIFYDLPSRVLVLLQDAEKDFESNLDRSPSVNLTSLAPAGYNGFRWATQPDPLWNCYLLALVLSFADRAEKGRVSVDEGCIYSYRFDPDLTSGSLFNPNIGWSEFKSRSLQLAEDGEFILVCDISDFYQRAYHHRVDNALRYIDDGTHRYRQIMALLGQFSNNVSYGLPIGGPASRILAELLLNSTDRLLRANGIRFVRFVDDYHFFAKSRSDAHEILVRVSEVLYANEGLSLQKSKTRIMTSAEFVSSTSLLDGDFDDSGRASHLRLSLRFDPYSANPKQDYLELEEAVSKIDVLGMLAKELSKTRVHSPVVRKLIGAIQFLQPKQRDDAVLSLVRNFEILSPLFGTVAVTIKGLLTELGIEARDVVLAAVLALIRDRSHIVQVDLHLAYAIRILGLHHSDEAEGLLTRTYESSHSVLVRKEIILAMARWKAVHWLADKKRFFQTMSPWEKRAFLVASYCLGDAGKHWRDHVKDTFDPFTALVHEWAGARADMIRAGRLPL